MKTLVWGWHTLGGLKSCDKLRDGVQEVLFLIYRAFSA